jgi:heme-degrading monooxygenase HmoA
MYARVNIWRLSEAGATSDDTAARELSAHLRAQPGFRSYTLIRTGEREAVAITVFDSEELLEQGLASAADLVRRRIDPLTAGPPERRSGPVLHHAAVR